MADGAALEGRGKRAAFALYYGPLHFLLVRGIVRGLGPALPFPRRILDLGCGTGSAGAAWALECTPPAAVSGVDRNGWAIQEARFTLRQLGVPGSAVRGDAVTADSPGSRAGWIAAFTVNELAQAARDRLLARLLDAVAAGSPVLVVEPISRRVSPWWPEWREKLLAIGGREDEWRLRPALPPVARAPGQGRRPRHPRADRPFPGARRLAPRGLRPRTVRQRPTVRGILFPERRHRASPRLSARGPQQGTARAGRYAVAFDRERLGSSLPRWRGLPPVALRAAGLPGHRLSSAAGQSVPRMGRERVLQCRAVREGPPERAC